MAHVLEQAGVRLGVAGGAEYVAMGVLVAAGAPTSAGVAVLLALTALASPTLPRPAALLLGVTGWALTTGFLVNGLGQLTFRGGDLLRLAAYAAVAALLAEHRPGGE
jgi:hypothetical protein